MLKTALTAAIIFGTASVALASEFDGNLQNRYPQVATETFQTSNVALAGNQTGSNEKAWFDRASRNSGGGY